MAQGTFREDLDVTPYLAKLGIENHGLHSAVIRVDGVDASQPYRAGQGPTVAATSTELVPGPGTIWDVNGYYRLFGIEWPYRPVSRRELRIGAMRLFDLEGQSEVATYALALLLRDSPARRDYLFRPLGDVFLDRFKMDALWGQAAELAALMTQESGELVTRREVMESWGLALIDPDEVEHEPVDPEDPDPEDPGVVDTADAAVSEVSATQTWDWSFYVQTAPRIDLDALRAWQEDLIRGVNYLTDHRPTEILEGFAVGVAGGQEWDWNVEAIDGELVFMLNADVVSDPVMAVEAIEWVTQPEQRRLFELRAAQRGTDEME